MTETLKHKEAYEFYYSLGDKRSYQQVASRFAVSNTSVKKWAVAFCWQKRIRERDQELGQRLEKVTNNSIVEEKARLLSVVKGSLNKFIERLRSGAIVPNSIADLERLVKLYLLLLEQNTDTVRHLEELAGKNSGVDCIDFIGFKFYDHVLTEDIVNILLVRT